MTTPSEPDPLKTDFHSLSILIQVYRMSSFRAAADELGMTQSSVSYAIDRLRTIFGDPLFVRLGRSVEPTERCTQIVAGAETLLRRFEALTVTDHFDPSVAEDRFVLSCNFYERSTFLPAIMAEIAATAPHVRVSVIHANSEGHRQLEAGICDVVIAPLLVRSAGIYSQRLLTERYACFVSHESPYAKRRMTLDDYAHARHLVVKPALGWRPFFHEALDRLGLAISPVLEVPSFGEIDRIISETDLVLTATGGLSRLYSPRIACVPAPFDCTFPVEMSWTGRTHTSPAHKWFRSLIISIAERIAAAEAGGPFGDTPQVPDGATESCHQ
ncbi:LysR family transcriptional regulator [Amorphus sp. 3PC139-8]|uniref:LysR family transcriptional regulator n=1 Tax=Amorphus sp. 3PC139-8 TaxID=2735676 RepID=UPI00345D304F